MTSHKLARWHEKRGLGRIAEFYSTNAKGILHVYSSGGEKRYALRFFVGDCQGFCPKVGDEVSFVYRSFRAMEIKKLDNRHATVISLDLARQRQLE